MENSGGGAYVNSSHYYMVAGIWLQHLPRHRYYNRAKGCTIFEVHIVWLRRYGVSKKLSKREAEMK